MTRSGVSPLRIVALGAALLAAPVMAAEIGDWDADGDGRLSRNEFRTGFERAGVFDRWDQDRDGFLSSDEIDSGLGENQEAFYDRFGDDISGWDTDGDGFFSRDEFYGGAFAGYGGEDTGYIEEPEYADVGDDIGDGGFWDV